MPLLSPTNELFDKFTGWQMPDGLVSQSHEFRSGQHLSPRRLAQLRFTSPLTLDYFIGERLRFHTWPAYRLGSERSASRRIHANLTPISFSHCPAVAST